MDLSDARLAARQRLIFALDVDAADTARDYVRLLQPVVSFFKVGLELFFAGGRELVEELVAKELRVFLDVKLLDIPATVERAVAAAARLGVAMVTVHAHPAAVAAACRGREGSGTEVFVVTLLTSQAPSGTAGGAADIVAERATIAVAAGADGVITAGRPEEIAAVRRVGPDLRIICPGIRPEGDAVGDQQRVVTPGDAIRAGADYLVVGRPIRDSAEPPLKARAIVEEMALALQERES
jgi:orotidine-5'-phosphate decarboxylase